MTPPRLYLAASVFSSFERERNSAIAQHLTDRGYQVFLPQNVRTSTGERPLAEVIFKECVDGINDSDLIVGLIDGPDVDSGTAWELGYAYAHMKPIVVLRSDYRSAENGPVNIMIQFSSRLVLANKPGTRTPDAIQALIEAVGRALTNPRA
jgi:nucleoside 2-deoxyribosyltransferase